MTELSDTIRSAALQNERTVWIREPLRRAANNLTIFLDAELYRDRVGAGDVIDTLISRNAIADSWFVFVSTQSIEARWKECPCYPPFADFVADELMAWLGSRAPELHEIQHRILVGLSYTGLAATYIAKEKPGCFQKVVSQSGSYWWNDGWLIQQYRELTRALPTAFYIEVGNRETQENVRHREDVLQVTSQIDAVRRFRDVLRATRHNVEYSEFDGAHDTAAWRRTLPDALAWALQKQH